MPVARIPIAAPLPGVFLPKKTIRKNAEIGRSGTSHASSRMPPATRRARAFSAVLCKELDHAVTTS